MRSIVSAAGFANGALKHYFDNKDEIVAATFESVLADTGENMNSSAESPLGPVEGLRAFVEAGMPLDEARIASARVLIALWNHAMTNHDLAKRYQDLLQTWRSDLVDRITHARGSRQLDDAAPSEVLADEVITVTVGAHVTSLMFPSGALAGNYQAYIDHFVARIAG